jgi:hypothetical protein
MTLDKQYGQAMDATLPNLRLANLAFYRSELLRRVRVDFTPLANGVFRSLFAQFSALPLFLAAFC